MRHRDDDESVNSGVIHIEVWTGANADDPAGDWHEWSIPYTADVTPYRRATYWQPEEGGEVENLTFGDATCTQTGETLTWEAWHTRYVEYQETMDEIERRAELAISECRAWCSYTVDETKKEAA